MKHDTAENKPIQEWERRYEKPLSAEDYKQICSNLDGFFTLLKKWDLANQTQIKGDCHEKNSKNI